jgi:hypothetical protein
MSEVQKRTFRYTKNENKRYKIFRFSYIVIYLNWDYVSGKKAKRKKQTNKQKRRIKKQLDSVFKKNNG